MSEIYQLLAIAKKVATEAGDLLYQNLDTEAKVYTFSKSLIREMKATVDRKLENEILRHLKPLGLPILSEESGEIIGEKNICLRFIVDPLDGTVNFIRGLGPSAVSISLYRGNTPIFGVLSIFPSRDLVWGGKSIGAFYNDMPIQVSDKTLPFESVLCTGIPSSFNFEENKSVRKFVDMLAIFGKVRMFGAASISLMNVAKGAAEAYSETEIMLWDVAAGLAIVEGAKGKILTKPGNKVNSLNVFASNGKINFQGLYL